MTVEKSWKGKNVFINLGASNHTDKVRQNEDYYATDPIAIDVLLNEGNLKLNHNVWECSAGRGDLSKRLEEFGYKVRSTDLIDRGYGIGGIDFLKCTEKWDGDILTNPPYSLAAEFIYHALELIPDGNQVAMFLKLQFMEGKARKKLFTEYPPKCIYVSSGRILCAKNADFEGMKAGGGSAVAFAWFVWEKGNRGSTMVKWIN